MVVVLLGFLQDHQNKGTLKKRHPVLVLKGGHMSFCPVDYHYWKYVIFSRGLKQMQVYGTESEK